MKFQCRISFLSYPVYLYICTTPGYSGLCLNFFRLLARKQNLEKQFLFIQTNSFIVFTCPNPVLLVLRARVLARRLLFLTEQMVSWKFGLDRFHFICNVPLNDMNFYILIFLYTIVRERLYINQGIICHENNSHKLHVLMVCSLRILQTKIRCYI